MKSTKGQLVLRLREGDHVLLGDELIVIKNIGSNVVEVFINADKKIKVQRRNTSREKRIIKQFLQEVE